MKPPNSGYPKLVPNVTVFFKLPPNSRHLSITDKFLKTRRCPLFRGFTVFALSTIEIQAAPEVQKQTFADFFKIGVIKNFAIFTGKHLCWSHLLTKLQPHYIEIATQLFFCEFWKIFKSSFFNLTPMMAPSGRCCENVGIYCSGESCSENKWSEICGQNRWLSLLKNGRFSKALF